MRIRQRLPFLITAALVCGSLPAAQAGFTLLPTSIFEANDMTPDGEIIVGSGVGGAYFWPWQTDPAPTFIGGDTAVGVSDDGTVIAGNIDHPTLGVGTAAVWTQATGWTPLGGLQGTCGTLSDAYEISGDGSTVVGLAWVNCSARGFKWTQAGGMEELESLANGNNRASTISADGSRIGGFAQGSFDRTPATWDASDLSGQLFDVDLVGEVYGFSDDGSITVGTISLGTTVGSPIDAFYSTAAGGVVGLPELNPNWIGQALDVTDDLNLIVGFDVLGFSREAWVWTPGGGTESLRDKLTNLGVTGMPANLEVCQAVSSDGHLIAGHGFGGAWVAALPPLPKVELYGCGVNPVGSLSVLVGQPKLGATIRFGIDNPLATQPPGSLALMSFATQPAPGYPCGLSLPGFGMSGPGMQGEYLLGFLPPNPILTLIGPAWNGVSPAVIPLFIPSDASLSGVFLYAQGVLYDFTLTSGIEFGLTDGLALRLGS